MKEIKAVEPVYIEQYDINVNPCLTYAQIQQIAEAVATSDSWAIRNQNIDMLIVYHATNIDKDTIEELGHETLLESGLIEVVRNNIRNLNQVYEAIEYNESIQRSLTQIIKALPKDLEPLEKVLKKYGNKVKE